MMLCFRRYVGQDVTGRLVTARSVASGVVDALGATPYFAALTLLFRLHQSTFIRGRKIAMLTAMTVDVAINHFLTYRALRLLGSRWWRGWVTAMSFCSAESLLNVGVLSFT
jgi:hypothetical protein